MIRHSTATEAAFVTPMADQRDLGASERHETARGGERILIRRARPEDMALYPDFLAEVGPRDDNR